MAAISGITGIPLRTANPVTSATANGATGFGSVLKSAIANVETYQQDANQAVAQFLQGNGELHNVAMATQRAEMAFDLGVQVRNKVVSAYQEIMKMQL